MDGTKAFFDELAGRWDEVNRYDRTEADFRGLVAQLGLARGSKVVDLGCGTGVLIPYLLSEVGASGMIYAVDVSTEMLKQLSAKYPNQNIRTYPLRAEQLSSISASVDGVICFSTFPHIADKPKALREIAGTLRPGAKLLVAHFSSMREINEFHAGQPDPICHHVLPDEVEMKSMMEKAGFEILRFIDKPSQYELLAERRGEPFSEATD